MERHTLWTLAVVCLLSLSLTAPGFANDLLLRGGQLVDPRSRTVVTADLWIVDGVIVDASSGPPAGFDGEIVDVTGKWIIPGLRDFHTHSVLNQALDGAREFFGTDGGARRMLYAGVTGFLDLFNQEDYVLSMRDRQRAGDGPIGADIFAAGPCLTATDGHCTEYPITTRIIDSPEDARREIGELAERRPDVVKVVYDHMREDLAKKTWRTLRPSIDRATLEASVAAAAAHGIPTVIHIRSWKDVRESVEVGATAVTHLPHEGPIPDGLAELMAERGTVVIPTLAVGDLFLLEQPEVLETKLAGAVTGDAIVAAYRDFDHDREWVGNMVSGLRHAHGIRLQNLAKLAAAGVPIVAGTDAGNTMTVQGFSLHRELELMVDAGLEPWQALAAATTAAGEFIGRSWGLDAGDEGSVVVLDASPIADIRNTRSIHGVVHHGVLVDREALLAVPETASATNLASTGYHSH